MNNKHTLTSLDIDKHIEELPKIKKYGNVIKPNDILVSKGTFFKVISVDNEHIKITDGFEINQTLTIKKGVKYTIVNDPTGNIFSELVNMASKVEPESDRYDLNENNKKNKMNRNKLINKLMLEGLTAKTLAMFTDKQLLDISKRMLSEQKGKLSVPADKLNNLDLAKITKDVDIDVTEEEEYSTDGFISFIIPNWAVGYLTNTTKENVDGEKVQVLKSFLSKVKQKYGTTDFMVDNDLDLGVCDSNDIYEESTECTRLLLKNDGNFQGSGEDAIIDKQNIREWVGNVVKKRYNSFTTKKNIMEMIKQRVKEQAPAPAPVKTPTKTPTKQPNNPEKTPSKRPTRDPWKKPNDQPNPEPKFKTKQVEDQPALEPKIKGKKTQLPKFLTFKELSKLS